MKILAISDKVVDSIYSLTISQRFPDIKLVLGCGDLPYYYMEFIISMLNVPLLYVHGNHDPEKEYSHSGQILTGPSGGFNMDGIVTNVNGFTIAGLEGSIRYKPMGQYQYSQFEMWLKILRMAPKLVLRKKFKNQNLDILIAHSPPFGIHNGNDFTHTGFEAFLWFMRVFKPRYLIHGHRHVYSTSEITHTHYEQTDVINVYPYKMLEIG